MRHVLIGVAATLAALAADMPSGHAQRSKSGPRPFCVQYSMFDTSGMRDCTYYTWQQCLASASGTGGYCIENPAIAWAQREQAQQRRRPKERY